MTEKLTRLQEAILRIDRLGLPLRDAVRLANIEAGFFVGQARYEEELRKALRIVGQGDEETPESQAS